MSENNNNEDSNKEICPYCQREVEDKEFDDHMMCHELENEEKSNIINNNINQNNENNINQNNNNNINQNNENNINQINRNNSSNRNNNSNSDGNNGNFLTQIFDIFNSSSQQNNSNNNNRNQIRRNNSSSINSNNNRNNNNNLSPFGFVSEIIKFADNYANNNHSNNQNRINSNNNIHRGDNPIRNGLTQIGNAFSNISRTVTSLNELTRQFNNLSTQMNSNSNSNSVRYRNPISNSNRNDNQAPPPVNNNNIPPNPNNINNNFFPPNILIPPIIIGHPGQIFNPLHQRNNINIDAIMNLLPSSTITEKKESEGQENNCIICIGDFEIGDKVTSLPCLHVFHTECIKSWLQSKNHCPICKYNITEEALRRGN